MAKIIQQIVIVLLLVLTQWTSNPLPLAQADSTIALKQYEAIKEVALEIYRKYPPSKFALVFPGGSGAPFAGMLEELTPHYAINMPVSFSHSWELPEDANKLAAIKKRAFKSFDQYITTEFVDGRQVVYVDYTYTAESYEKMHAYMNEYHSRRPALGAKPQFVALADMERQPYIEAGRRWVRTEFMKELRTEILETPNLSNGQKRKILKFLPEQDIFISVQDAKVTREIFLKRLPKGLRKTVLKDPEIFLLTADLDNGIEKYRGFRELPPEVDSINIKNETLNDSLRKHKLKGIREHPKIQLQKLTSEKVEALPDYTEYRKEVHQKMVRDPEIAPLMRANGCDITDLKPQRNLSP